MAHSRRYPCFTLDIGVKVWDQGHTRNVTQVTLHHMTYAPAEFDASTSNGLGGDALSTFDLDTFHEIIFIMWFMYLQILKLLRFTCYLRRQENKYIIWPFTHTKPCPIPCTVCDLCTLL